MCRTGGVPALHNIRLESPGRGKDFSFLSLVDAQIIQCFRGMPNEHIPIALADGEAVMRRFHVTARVMSRTAKSRAQEVDQELPFLRQAILTLSSPIRRQLRITHQTR